MNSGPESGFAKDFSILDPQFRQSIDNLAEGFIICSQLKNNSGVITDFVYFYVNNAFAQLAKLDKKNMIGKKISETFPGFLESELFELCCRSVDSGGPVFLPSLYLKNILRDKEAEDYFDITITSCRDGIILTANNVTGIKKRELEEVNQKLLAAVKEEKDWLSALVRSINDEIWFSDTQKNVTLVNPAVLREFGENALAPRAVEKIASQLEVYRPDGSPRPISEAPLLRALNGEVLKEQDEFIRTPAAGELRYRRVSAAPVRDSSGSIIGSVAVVRDTTKERETQLKLEQTIAELERSNKELEQFAYVASHDLQEPLRMVSNFTKLLSKHYSDSLDIKAGEYIDFILKNSKRMSQLINDLLQYSRVTSKGEVFIPTDINKTVEEALKNLQFSIEESNTVIKYENLPSVKADPSQMIHLFQNLVSNSIKFRRSEKPVIEIEAHNKEKHWVFSIKDNGIGIDPQYFDRIFIIFQRLHSDRVEYPGTGIGLALCKKIVERHGGSIWVESKEGYGTTFYFSIPKY